MGLAHSVVQVMPTNFSFMYVSGYGYYSVIDFPKSTWYLKHTLFGYRC